MALPKAVLIFVFLILAFSSAASAAVPRVISVQGKLTDGTGINAITTQTDVTFRIFNNPTGTGVPLWTEDWTGVNGITPNDFGIFSVLLGSRSTLSLPFNESYWLQVVVDGFFLEPLQQIGSAGYSIRSENPWNNTGNNIYAMGNVGIGTTAPAYELDLNGSLRLQPRTNIAGMNGVIYYDGNIGKFQCYESGIWKDCIGSGGPGGGSGYGWSTTIGPLGPIVYNNTAGVTVGIGTNAPAGKLGIKDTTNAAISIDSGAANIASIDFYGNGLNEWGLGRTGANSFYIDEFGAGNRLTILPGGNVGIGTTNPAQKLEVVGKIKIGNDAATPSAGTMRWSGTSFEGYNGTAWNAFTGASGGGGTVTSVGTGVGLTGGPITTSGIINLNINGGVAQTCAGTQKVSSVSPAGIVTCTNDVDTNSGGTVTQVNTGPGLTGGPISASGTVSLNTAGIGTCTNPVTNKIYWDPMSLTLGCGTDQTGGGSGYGWSTTIGPLGPIVYNNTAGVTVGIGTNAPAGKLGIKDTTNAAISIDSGAANIASIDFYGNGLNEWGLGRTGANSFYIDEFGAGNRLTILPGGNVGIGTTNPAQKLTIVGDVSWTGTLQGGSVPWARLTGFPTACPAGFVTGVGGTLSCAGESDPQVGTLTNGKWCTSNGVQVNCNSDLPQASAQNVYTTTTVPSRNFDVTYQNTGTKPLFVTATINVMASSNDWASFSVKAGASNPPTTVVAQPYLMKSSLGDEVTAQIPVSFFVLPSNYYRIDATTSGGAGVTYSLVSWTEWA